MPDEDLKAGKSEKVSLKLPNGVQLVGRLQRVGPLEPDVPDCIPSSPALPVDQVAGEEDSCPTQSCVAVDGHFPLAESKGEDLNGIQDALQGSMTVILPSKVVVVNWWQKGSM